MCVIAETSTVAATPVVTTTSASPSKLIVSCICVCMYREMHNCFSIVTKLIVALSHVSITDYLFSTWLLFYIKVCYIQSVLTTDL